MENWDEGKLLTEYQDYISENSLTITEKQIAYIIKLHQNIKDENIRERYTNTLKTLSKLSDKDIFVLIEELKRESSITPCQFLQIINVFEDDDIESILKKDVSDLTQKDVEILFNGPDKFKPWIREHPEISGDEFEYGWQESDKFKDGRMYYLKLYNMLMLDIDGSVELETLKEKLYRYPRYLFRLYKTFGGYHVFVISELINYRDPRVIQLSKELGADFYYALFAYKTGFKIRLSPKLGRSEERRV